MLHLLKWRGRKPRTTKKRLSELGGEEAGFLAGRRSKVSEALRVVRIAVEFIRGFRTFHYLGPAVTVFGSARFKEGHEYYEQARRIGAGLARTGVTVVTGGGPGIMEAANRGAFEAGGISVGAPIALPHEETRNRFLSRYITFSYFFVRKVILVKYSFAYVVMPGGFGTLDELTEALTLIQTGKLYDFPVILVGTSYWHGLLSFIRGEMLKNRTIDPQDLEWLVVTDSPEEVIKIVKATARKCGFKLVPPVDYPEHPPGTHGS